MHQCKAWVSALNARPAPIVMTQMVLQSLKTAQRSTIVQLARRTLSLAQMAPTLRSTKMASRMKISVQLAQLDIIARMESGIAPRHAVLAIIVTQVHLSPMKRTISAHQASSAQKVQSYPQLAKRENSLSQVLRVRTIVSIVLRGTIALLVSLPLI